MPAPFGTPTLWVVSPASSSSSTLTAFVDGIAKSPLHAFDSKSPADIRKREDLYLPLREHSAEDLFNLVCIVDLGVSDTFTFDISQDRHPLQPTELVLLYPEVYWIFIVA